MEAVLAPNGFFDSLGDAKFGPTNIGSLEPDELQDLTLVLGLGLGCGPGTFLVFSTEDAPDGFESWDEYIGDEPEPPEHLLARRLGALEFDQAEPDSVSQLTLPYGDCESMFTLYQFHGQVTIGESPLSVLRLEIDGEGGAPSLYIVHRAP